MDKKFFYPKERYLKNMNGLNFGDEIAPSKLLIKHTEPFFSTGILIPVYLTVSKFDLQKEKCLLS